MDQTIGYLIPEFPGQTHIFLWREMQCLKELGVGVKLISTRRPEAKIASHVWATEAIAQTHYLFPPTIATTLASVATLLKAGPIAWLRCLQVVLRADDVDLKGRARLLVLTLIAAQLVNVARQQGWSHVHVHSCADGANIALLAHLISPRLSYSLTLHGPRLEDYGPNQKQKWQRAAFSVIISQKLYRDVQNVLQGFLPPVLKVAPMGVDLQNFHRQQPYNPWPGTGPCRIFACGRLNAVKGHNFLIQAIATIRQQGIDASLKIAGSEDPGNLAYREYLESLIAELGLQEHVTLLGAVSEKVVQHELEQAHLFVLNSQREGIPVAVMEAMAMEVPVIVTDIDGNRELIDEAKDGLFIQPDRPQETAEAIMSLLHQPDLACQLSTAARQKIQQSFHSKISAETIAQCLPSKVEA